MNASRSLLPLSPDAHDIERDQHYQAVRGRIDALLADETDWIAAMATVACELHHAFAYFQWTGFYRVVPGREELLIGPYQGTHGCLRIPFGQGICGTVAMSREARLIEDVARVPEHIACSATTRSEIVVPVTSGWGKLLAVLDVDSDTLAAFNNVDLRHLGELCESLGTKYESDALA